jgi:hypothetical protein
MLHYNDEKFPAHIKFIKNTVENIRILENSYGKLNVGLNKINDAPYLEINLRKESWR